MEQRDLNTAHNRDLWGIYQMWICNAGTWITTNKGKIQAMDIKFLRRTEEKQKLNSVALVRERTIPTERPPLVGEVSANFSG
jgi:hypothetical protein